MVTSSSIDEKVSNILKGSIDLHVHTRLSADDTWDLMEIGRGIESIGMQGVVLKNLHGSSGDSCSLANRALGTKRFYGSLVLGEATGGINPNAVGNFADAGDGNRVVEMPVNDSSHHNFLWGKRSDSGIRVMSKGRPEPGVRQVLKIIADRDLILKTGHIAPQESLALIRLATEIGVKKIIVTHATGAPVMARIDEQVAMASQGAVIEHCLGKFLPLSIWKHTTRLTNYASGMRIGDLDYLKESINVVGPHQCLIATDASQLSRFYPHLQFKYFLYLLFEMGFSYEAVRIMAKGNPRKILGFTADA
jgi:hypothetical protein